MTAGLQRGKGNMIQRQKGNMIQSGVSSLAKHGGAYFSAVCGSIQDPIAASGPYENQEF